MPNISNKKLKIGVVLFSGGQDSTTVLTYAKKLGYELYAITYLYGQSLKREIQQAKKICKQLKIKHVIFDCSIYKDIAWYSALTHPDSYPIPKYKNHKQIGKTIPFTYVPMRNSFFIICSTAYLESLILNKIEMEYIKPKNIRASLFLAVNNIDYSNYPDCRPEYIHQMEQLLQQASKVGVFYKIPIQINTPLINMSKKEITELGIQLNAPIELTQTCYIGDEKACGKCPSCLLRINGFKDAGYIDPIKYDIPIDWTRCKPIK
jgi:7-cyano-7-deazaguanine synthase